MKNIVVLTGAGMSAESGIKTFRDAGGLWEGFEIEEVATPGAFEKNPKLVFDFYNQRRKQLFDVEPNKATNIPSSTVKPMKLCLIGRIGGSVHFKLWAQKTTMP